MSDLEREYVVQSKAPGWLIGVSVVSLLLALGALGWSLGLQNHLTAAEGQLTAATQQNTQLSEKLEDTNERLRAQGEALGQSVGLTQKQLEDKSNQLVAAQKQAVAATARLRKEEVETTAAGWRGEAGCLGGEDRCGKHED